MGKAAPPASARVQDEWLRRVEAEYRSTAVATHLALWLVQIGASPDLVRWALRIAREELGHAAMSHRVYVAASAHSRGAGRTSRTTETGDRGRAETPALDRASLELSRHPDEPLEYDVARVCVDVFCLGETVAVRLFQGMRQRCDVPVARKTLDRVLRDEVGHRDFGWKLLEWLLQLPHLGARLGELVSAELPGRVQSLRAHYAPHGLHVSSVISPDDARWGLMPSARYGELLRICAAKDYGPRFTRLGIDARLARFPMSE